MGGGLLNHALPPAPCSDDVPLPKPTRETKHVQPTRPSLNTPSQAAPLERLRYVVLCAPPPEEGQT